MNCSESTLDQGSSGFSSIPLLSPAKPCAKSSSSLSRTGGDLTAQQRGASPSPQHRLQSTSSSPLAFPRCFSRLLLLWLFPEPRWWAQRAACTGDPRAPSAAWASPGFGRPRGIQQVLPSPGRKEQPCWISPQLPLEVWLNHVTAFTTASSSRRILLRPLVVESLGPLQEHPLGRQGRCQNILFCCERFWRVEKGMKSGSNSPSFCSETQSFQTGSWEQSLASLLARSPDPCP